MNEKIIAKLDETEKDLLYFAPDNMVKPLIAALRRAMEDNNELPAPVAALQKRDIERILWV
jgi:hypothetical protein